MSHFQGIADRLVQDGYLLTALELHTELEERGKPLKSLKEFFENSSNFEKFTRQTSTKKTPSPAESISSITGSQFTDGSLFNMTRYSEDSHLHAEADKVAILEFELRRATQTINSLRNELTQQVRQYDPDKRRSIQKHRNESGTKDSNDGNSHADNIDLQPPGDEDVNDKQITSENPKIASDSDSSYDMLQQNHDNNTMEDDDEEEESLELFGHEKRVLNYLVNEYLLQHGYKLTAITFSDEITDEDFEDWDSIGLNISKPPDLGRIYRNFNLRKSKYAINKNQSVTCNCNKVETSDSCLQCEIISECDAELREIIFSNESEMEELRMKLQDEISKNDFSREINEKHEHFEKLENELKKQIQILEEQTHSLFRPPKSNDDKENDDVEMNIDVTDSINPLIDVNDEYLEILPTLQIDITEKYAGEDSESFLAFIKKKCIPNLDGLNHLEDNSVSNVGTFEEIISLLANELPQIIPHVLLARRGTVLPLLLIAVEHHTSPEVRDNLLTILFNLTKKPDEEMRSVIVKGFVEIVSRQNTGNNTTLVEAEILPQLWQQIEHKHLERRILVAETCAWLLPNIPSDIRDSLVFSMLQQLVMQDRENQVRQVALNSLSMLILYLKDTDKLHNVISNILRPCLSDPSDNIVITAQEGLLLSVAFRLAMADLNHLFQTTMNELNKSCQMLDTPDTKVTSQSGNTNIHQGSYPESVSSNVFSGGLSIVMLHKLRTCQYLLPFVISCVIKSAPFYEDEVEIDSSSYNKCEQDNNEDDTEGSEGCNVTMDTVFPLLFNTKQDAMKYLSILQEYLSREWYEPWYELTWISDVLLVSMIQSACTIPIPTEMCCDRSHTLHNEKESVTEDSSCHSCPDNLILQYIRFFRELTIVLGQDYSNKYVVSKFEEKLLMLSTSSEECISSNLETKSNEDDEIYTSAILPIYTLGVLSNFRTGSQLTRTLGSWCILYCLKGYPTHPMIFVIHYILKMGRPKQQNKNDEWYSEIRDSLSEMAWTLLVHSSAKVRIFSGVILDILASSDFTGTYDLVGTKILPGLVTLSSDSDHKVQKSAISGLGSIIYAVSQGRRISNETSEKALFQLTSLLSEDGDENRQTPSNMKNVHEINMEIAETISSIILKYNQNLNSKRRESNNSNNLHFMSIRDDVLIPKLYLINNKYVGKEYPDSKCLEMCNNLLNIYRTMVFEVKLPPPIFQCYVVPSLGKLSKDFHRFGIVAQETACLQLITQLEADYGTTNPGANHFSSAIPNINSAMSSSPSIDEMKNKMGKLKGFWKK